MADRSTTADDLRPASIDPRLIGAVEVTLEAVIGSATLSVGDLAALKADATLILDAALSAPVELRLNGVAIARGELVAVDDRFAVRLIEIGT